jgi:SAM-dependent methyltransferase
MTPWNHSKDTEKERQRYNLASSLKLSSDLNDFDEGYAHFSQEHIAPFKKYYDYIAEEVINATDILEIGAGTGQHTRPAITPHSYLTVLDISENSIVFLQNKFSNSVKAVVGNMEELPFPDSSFDLIISCGALSYGDPSKVDREIIRTLRPGGTFILVDSLNHNPLFKLNRWIRFLRGSRSLSTVLRIPKMKRILELANSFHESEIISFGKWIWIHKILNLFLSDELSMRIYNSIEDSNAKSKYGFKIVAKLKNKKL